jgi:hypothetical protein
MSDKHKLAKQYAVPSNRAANNCIAEGGRRISCFERKVLCACGQSK